jgi:hypothetical protein
MIPGDRVEINNFSAGPGSLRPPLREWHGGYTFVRTDGRMTVVRIRHGKFAGCEVWYPAMDVRLAKRPAS